MTRIDTLAVMAKLSGLDVALTRDGIPTLDDSLREQLEIFAVMVGAAKKEECAKACDEYAEKELSKEMTRINEDDCSRFPDVDFDSDDESLNERHPKIMAETIAKATAWMMMQCGCNIRALKDEVSE